MAAFHYPYRAVRPGRRSITWDFGDGSRGPFFVNWGGRMAAALQIVGRFASGGGLPTLAVSREARSEIQDSRRFEIWGKGERGNEHAEKRNEDAGKGNKQAPSGNSPTMLPGAVGESWWGAVRELCCQGQCANHAEGAVRERHFVPITAIRLTVPAMQHRS
jgi:hypothetical protein